MSTALCIVDMQTDFKDSAGDGVIRGVIHQIKLAKKRKAPVIVVRLPGCGPNLEPIEKALKNLPKKQVIRITKQNQGGGREVITAAQRRKIPFDKIRVCGVNQCQCVHDTIMEIRDAKKFKRVEISMKGTGCFHRCDCGKTYYKREGIVPV